MSKYPPTIIDLFCGAGGLSLGFERAGFEAVLALDKWAVAVETYRENLGGHAEEADLSGRLELPGATVIAGGPPCQGFSSAGSRRDGDQRNTLVGAFARTIAEHRPEAFVFENVEGFLTMGEGRFVFDLLDPLVESGYRIHMVKLNAANFGVPQHRKRVIAIGGLGWTPKMPEPTHSVWGAPGSISLGEGYPRTATFAEALDGLPRAAECGEGARGSDHAYVPLTGRDVERAAHLEPGQRMRDLPPEFRHESFGRRANRRVMDGTPSERRGGAPSGVRRLRADEPSKAITGGDIERVFASDTRSRIDDPGVCAVADVPG